MISSLEPIGIEVSINGHWISFYTYIKINNSHFGPVANSDSNLLMRTWSPNTLHYSACYAFKPLTRYLIIYLVWNLGDRLDYRILFMGLILNQQVWNNKSVITTGWASAYISLEFSGILVKTVKFWPGNQKRRHLLVRTAPLDSMYHMPCSIQVLHVHCNS